MNKFHKILKSLTVVAMATIINACGQFLTIPFLVRVLTVEQYGDVGLYMSLAMILQMVVSFSAGNYLSVRMNKENLSIQAIYGNFVIFSLFFLIAETFIVTLIILLGFFDVLPNGLTIDTIIYAAVTSFGYAVSNTVYSLFIAMHRPLRGLWIVVFQSLVPLALTIALIEPGPHSDKTRMQILALSMLVLAIAINIVALKKSSGTFLAIKERVFGLISFGIRLLPHTLGILLFTSVDKIFISKYYDATSLGNYIFAFQLAGAISLFFEVLNSLYAPFLYKELSSESPRKFALVRWSYIFFILVLSLFPVLYFSSSFVVLLMGGISLLSADGLFVLISVGSCFTGMYFVVTNYVLFSERGDLLSVISVFSGTVYIALIYIFRYDGVFYAAFSYGFACFVRFILTFWCANKVYPMPWFSFKGI